MEPRMHDGTGTTVHQSHRCLVLVSGPSRATRSKARHMSVCPTPCFAAIVNFHLVCSRPASHPEAINSAVWEASCPGAIIRELLGLTTSLSAVAGSEATRPKMKGTTTRRPSPRLARMGSSVAEALFEVRSAVELFQGRNYIY